MENLNLEIQNYYTEAKEIRKQYPNERGSNTKALERMMEYMDKLNKKTKGGKFNN